MCLSGASQRKVVSFVEKIMTARIAWIKTVQEGGGAVTALAHMQQTINGVLSTGNNLLKIIHHTATMYMYRTDHRRNNKHASNINLGQINISGLLTFQKWVAIVAMLPRGFFSKPRGFS